ncbi:DUF1822 family protein [Trichocoleus sp. FACHB-262]|uniref:DUF1822 family protein n=1 Tax=Trichocoleus sp. FACHB-262 TaxID=2692869 RepID=UPI0016826E93|nr:DUF1822 family protein [Trichocoleus sp. FACHB-262]MBD2123239.1 DUF1822 family protein [Trichocoleus sp. FACHB-262]
MNSTHTPLLTVPLSHDAHTWARKFAAEQINPHHGKRVYLNTLAVYAVHTYLRWIRIATDLSQGDSWQLHLQAVLDVADLVIPNVGKLECRPILPETSVCHLPPETLDQRIGYVGVQFQTQLDAVQLLGFVPAIAPSPSPPTQLPLTEFQALANLVAHLHHLQSIQATSAPEPRIAAPTVSVNLGQWLQNQFEVGWQTLEDLFGGDLRPGFNFRGDRSSPALASSEASLEPSTGVRRGKLIELGGQPTAHGAALVVEVTPLPETSEMKHEVLLQVHPTREQRFLPPNLQLIVLDAANQPVLDASGTPLAVHSHQTDNFIQLLLRGQTGEQFHVRLVLGNVSVTEKFVI